MCPMWKILLIVAVAVAIVNAITFNTDNDFQDRGNRSHLINDSSSGHDIEQQVDPASDIWSKIRHLHQKVRLKEVDKDSNLGEQSERNQELDDRQYPEDKYEASGNQDSLAGNYATGTTKAQSKTYRIVASGPRKSVLLATNRKRSTSETGNSMQPVTLAVVSETRQSNDKMSGTTSSTLQEEIPAGSTDEDDNSADVGQDEYDSAETTWLDDPNAYEPSGNAKPDLDIVTKFLRIVESQHLLGENCTAGTELNLGDRVVDRYAQDRFRLVADVAVNRANWLTRLWKYAEQSVLDSEYLLHVNVYSMIEMDENIFAAGNCYDKHQYKNYILFCPWGYRKNHGPILVKDLAIEYKYLSNTSDWFYAARKNAERVIRNMTSLTKGKSISICFFFLFVSMVCIFKSFQYFEKQVAINEKRRYRATHLVVSHTSCRLLFQMI